ncbi:hypothetical protein P154DRAFT_526245 [Amniculicola lignicola CBS 123094]|uniref:EH domain-containing protein n=1 Tax=Amniculicola lignicola CBS 123094 TaxID=1392246 RepID=A0A6A5W3P0_9PLEO|nr:hypothetical protein P154DRAFT_526245 [Amniculicola lignicola CBS 123094]
MSSAASARSTAQAQAPQTTGDTQYNVPNAALRGASSAFSKPAVKPKPQVNTYTGGSNGALLAATKAGTTGTPRNQTPLGSPSSLRRDWTGDSHSNTRPAQPPRHYLSKSSSSSSLGVPVPDYLSDRTPSPSNIAAKLAAARHSPMKPIPQARGTSIMSERHADERDVLPPAGSVGSVLARLNPHQQPPRSNNNNNNRAHSGVSTVRTPPEETKTKAVDDTPIPSTTALAKMFEQRPKTPTPQAAEPMVFTRAPPPVSSPKPQRKITLPPEPKEGEPLGRSTEREAPPPVKPKPKAVRDFAFSSDGPRDETSFSMLRKDSLGTPPIRQKPVELKAVKTAPRPRSRHKSQDIGQPPPLQTAMHRRFSTSHESNKSLSSPSSYTSAPEVQEQEKPKPSLPPPRRSGGKTKPLEARTKASSAPPKQHTPMNMTSPSRALALYPPERLTPRQMSPSATSSPPSESIYHNNYQRESVKAITKHMTGESLSSAIMGAALASSRNASPAPPSVTATPALPARRQHHHSPFRPNRSPSPPKPTGRMKTTLRKEPSSSDDEDEKERYKKKGSRVFGVGRKHPNKHHEGTRKRWRDAVTERERKRYEGVWAANKGLHIHTPSYSPSRHPDDADPALDVLNLVTKELWTRSRLPEHELEEVWTLVDSRNVGSLRREEFVVGMWLIDQRLKGRKLPVRVGESVWSSVRGSGVKVKVKVPKSGHGHGHGSKS